MSLAGVLSRPFKNPMTIGSVVGLISALPTAQNVYVMAVRYQQATVLARDAIFISTIASVPVVLVISALLA